MTYSRQHNWLHHPLKVTSSSYLDTGHIYTYSDGEVHCMVVIFGICTKYWLYLWHCCLH